MLDLHKIIPFLSTGRFTYFYINYLSLFLFGETIFTLTVLLEYLVDCIVIFEGTRCWRPHTDLNKNSTVNRGIWS